MKKNTIIGIIILVLGALLALVPQFILPVCSKMLELANGNAVPMACHYTGLFATVAGILIAFYGLLSILLRKAQTWIALGFGTVALAFATLLVSTALIGVCKNATMPCHMGTQPAVIVLCALIIVCGIVQLITGIKTSRGEDQ